MSPTVLRERGYRLFFFSREESRLHIHVQAAHGEAKFWLAPRVELAQNHGLTQRDLRFLVGLIEANVDVIKAAWHEHFGR